MYLCLYFIYRVYIYIASKIECIYMHNTYVNIYILCMYVCMYVCVCVCVYVCVCVCMCTHTHTHTHTQMRSVTRILVPERCSTGLILN